MSDLLLDAAADAVWQTCPDDTAPSVAVDCETAWQSERMSPTMKASFGR